MNKFTAYRLLTPGTEIYYTGDMANAPAFGKVTRIYDDNWGTHVEITYDDGTRTSLSPSSFSEVYSGNGSTRFVTKSAYLTWKAEQVEAFKRAYPKYSQEAAQ